MSIWSASFSHSGLFLSFWKRSESQRLLYPLQFLVTSWLTKTRATSQRLRVRSLDDSRSRSIWHRYLEEN